MFFLALFCLEMGCGEDRVVVVVRDARLSWGRTGRWRCGMVVSFTRVCMYLTGDGGIVKETYVPTCTQEVILYVYPSRSCCDAAAAGRQGKQNRHEAACLLACLLHVARMFDVTIGWHVCALPCLARLSDTPIPPCEVIRSVHRAWIVTTVGQGGLDVGSDEPCAGPRGDT